jgi:hypothetical protein
VNGDIERNAHEGIKHDCFGEIEGINTAIMG